MRAQSFGDYLLQEQQAVRLALLAAYENRDRLLYLEAPALRQEYMLKIGQYEEGVLQAELAVALLRKKAEKIQAAINRREAVDEAQIDAELEAEKDEKLQALEDADRTLNELPQLSDEAKKDLQRCYRHIIDDFHPGLHPGLSDTEKQLYDRAMEAYQRQDLAAMKLLYDMLYEDDGETTISIKTDDLMPTPEERRERYHSIAVELSTDYTLAKTLYDCFARTEDDAVILNAIAQYRQSRDEVNAEVEQIRKSFPFNAQETLNSARLTDEYLSDLAARKRRCEDEEHELNVRIAKMLEVSAHG